eukprot:2772291-Amphidinium_carterae.1
MPPVGPDAPGLATDLDSCCLPEVFDQRLSKIKPGSPNGDAEFVAYCCWRGTNCPCKGLLEFDKAPAARRALQGADADGR